MTVVAIVTHRRVSDPEFMDGGIAFSRPVPEKCAAAARALYYYVYNLYTSGTTCAIMYAKNARRLPFSSSFLIERDDHIKSTNEAPLCGKQYYI